MARARNIKPGFFESEKLGRCPFGARLLFIAMWQVADRVGKMEERMMRLRAYAFPYDSVSMAEIEEWANFLESEKLIERYTVGEGKYIRIPKFTKHQNPHVNEKESGFPDKPSASTVPAPDFPNTKSEKVQCLNDTLFDSSTKEILLIKESLLLNPDIPHSGAVVGKPKPERKVFQKPTVEQIAEYCRDHGITNVDPEYFWLKHESIGWVVGKARNPMKCWKSTVQTWAKNGYSSQSAHNPPAPETSIRFVPKPRPVEEEPVTTDEMMRLFYEGTQ